MKSNFESNLILGQVRQLLNGKGLEWIVLDNDITAHDLLSEYKIRGPFASIFSFRLNSFHLTQLTTLVKTSMIASCGRN